MSTEEKKARLKRQLEVDVLYAVQRFIDANDAVERRLSAMIQEQMKTSGSFSVYNVLTARSDYNTAMTVKDDCLRHLVAAHSSLDRYHKQADAIPEDGAKPGEVSTAHLTPDEIVFAGESGALRVNDDGLGFVPKGWLSRLREARAISSPKEPA